jgi:hypothetical protein
VATELLFEAYKNYIEPLLDFGWIRLNEQGFLVEREHGNLLHYINDHYTGQEGEVPCTYPVIPLSDEHYIQIKENPEWELFNPFSSIKHMTLVILEFKRGLINFHLSDEASNLDLDQQEELIRFYYEEHGADSYRVGFCNVEDEANPKELYSYIGNSFIEAMWGLCVTVFNDLDRKHAGYFYTIEKTWRKITRLINKWDEERIKIVQQTKIDQQDHGFKYIDFSDTATDKITTFAPDYFIAPEEQEAYLFGLFGPHELLEAVSNEPAIPITIKERVWQLPDFASDETLFKEANKSSRKKKKNTIEAEVIEVVEPPPDSPSPPVLEYQAEVELEMPEEKKKDNTPQIKILEEKIPEEMPPQKQWPQVPQYPKQVYPFQNQFGYYNPFMPQPMYMPQNIPTDLNDIDFEGNERPDPFASYRKY